jgi:fumarate reductase subunit D
VGRLVGVATVVAMAAVVSTANRGAHHSVVHFCCGYTPARLAAGAWWTLLGSALLIAHLRLVGSNTVLLVGVLVPYGLRQGSRRTLAAFFTGHVLATLAVAAVVLPLAAGGWHAAEVVRGQLDVGVSVGVAAVAGALAVSLRRRRWRAALFGAFATFFATNLLLFHALSDVEHLIGLAAGALLGRRWTTGSPSVRFIAGSWRHRQADRRHRREERQAMAEPHQTGNGPEELAELAWMVDWAVRFGERSQAAELAERLLEELSRHYRAMRPLRLRCAPHVGAALADEAFALIGDVEQLATASPGATAGDRSVGAADLRSRVERLVAHEAAEMAALGPQP